MINLIKSFNNKKIEWKYFLLLLFVYFLLTIPLGVIIGLLLKAFNITHAFKNNDNLSFWKVVIVAPLIEECLFRLLLKPRFKNLIAYSIITSPFVLYLFRNGEQTIAIVLVGVLVGVALLIFKRQEYLIKFYRIFLKRFSYLFYLSIFVFGFIHLRNFIFPELSIWIVLIFPLLVSPQLIIGGILGFIRMKWGFIYCVLFHAMVNGIIYLLRVI
ncbi:type II CAAX prenyl endopeptidase Rce1 family protein [Marinifilum fragile]|uniref:CPBP family glutamic-type intramembrane protease n=1 Tax=Marinifilum fragile TaxID=570161 RepID=UPI002AA8B90A|nr:CPBP family glutamic-type intramembrane protease [Marinifilum fragile]